MTKIQLWKKSFFSSNFHIAVITKESQVRNSSSAGTWRQELIQRMWRSGVYCITSQHLLSLLICQFSHNMEFYSPRQSDSSFLREPQVHTKYFAQHSKAACYPEVFESRCCLYDRIMRLGWQEEIWPQGLLSQDSIIAFTKATSHVLKPEDTKGLPLDMLLI